MRVGIYVRVSKKGLVTDNQLNDLRAFVATQPGWQITHEFIETVTGSGLKQRKEFDAMMLAASQRQFDFLLIWKLDRLTRQGISATLKCLENLDSWGIRWRSYTEPFLDTGNEMTNKIVLTVISEMAKAERETLIARTMAGLRTAKRNGKILGRPRREIDWKKVNERHGAGESVRAIARSMKVSHSLLLKGLQS
jgi:DNA invertase Pin-like site-specific DNA recombinase